MGYMPKPPETSPTPQVMGYLRRMARDNGHIVIACIHQPRAAIWSMFDTVRGGGPSGRAPSPSPPPAGRNSRGGRARSGPPARAGVAHA
jgi:hypothetical protein